MTRRTQRINDLIREEISQLLHKGVKDPRLRGFITITEVVTSPDLRYAKVFVSVMGREEEKKNALQGLSAASGFLRRELRSRLALRYIPDLSFYQDNSLEQAAHVLDLIKQVSSEHTPKESHS